MADHISAPIPTLPGAGEAPRGPEDVPWDVVSMYSEALAANDQTAAGVNMLQPGVEPAAGESPLYSPDTPFALTAAAAVAPELRRHRRGLRTVSTVAGVVLLAGGLAACEQKEGRTGVLTKQDKKEVKVRTIEVPCGEVVEKKVRVSRSNVAGATIIFLSNTDKEIARVTLTSPTKNSKHPRYGALKGNVRKMTDHRAFRRFKGTGDNEDDRFRYTGKKKAGQTRELTVIADASKCD